MLNSSFLRSRISLATSVTFSTFISQRKKHNSLHVEDGIATGSTRKVQKDRNISNYRKRGYRF